MEMVTVNHYTPHGIAGAQALVRVLTRSTGWVDATHIELGDEGARVLMAGLGKWLTVVDEPRQFAVAEASHPSSTVAVLPRCRVHNWLKVQLLSVLGRTPQEEPVPFLPRSFRGISILRLNQNDIGDEGLCAVLTYASQDWSLTEVFLECNNFKLQDADTLRQAVTHLNNSGLQSLSLSDNPLTSSGVIQLFNLLDAPCLRGLDVGGCQVGAECLPAIVGFFTSPRGRRLHDFEMRTHGLGEDDVRELLDGLEGGNSGLTTFDVLPRLFTVVPGMFEIPPPPIDRGRRLCDRNGDLAWRVRVAAVRALAPTRIIVHGLKLPATEATVVQPSKSHKRWPSRALKALRPVPRQTFPLLDLPREIQLQIARLCSGDANAFSGAQWSRLTAYASDRKTLGSTPHRGPVDVRNDERRRRMLREFDQWFSGIDCWSWERD
ncbi:uncharacterized protein LOC62_04G006241 [Vanrija pseudolonga]|uniref:F-box domain-containing protein n=1 Tax=Vanrija pseudolonga TaxID=143232 RepID=A0AAF0Y9Q3_9TREE|nr:hypothetical protein LOC62_04G006241 [Vanrija pseudolonga]